MQRNLSAIALLGMLMCAAPASAADRNVALILDASGSMNGRLADGSRKIVAAKSAVADLVQKIPDDVNLSFRAYGHQHHRSKHDCKDTQLLVPAGSAAANRNDITGSSEALKAQGYTPITYVLGLAADDLKEATGQKTIVLVSDGKETCEGDPCVLARKLAEADADLTIHTVGFGVDAQARLQLQCIAGTARGSYRDAGTALDLLKTMEKAAIDPPEEITEEVVTLVLPKNEDGKLEIVGPYFNEVVDPETGEKVATVTERAPVATLASGIYNVSFGKAMWLKSVAVEAGKTTTIRPGRLSVVDPYFNEVRDPETGAVLEKATGHHSEFPLLAGRYDVSFGKALWRGVTIEEGKITVLNPARLRIKGPYFNDVIDPETGQVLLKLTGNNPELPLPPGTYDVRFGKKLWKGISLKEGETTELNPGRIKMAAPYFNKIIDDETGKEVEKLTSNHKDIPLPPGNYSVQFGKILWKGFELAEGQELTITPGRIKIDGDGFFVDMFDEAGNEVIKLSRSTNDIPVPPGRYTLKVSGQEVPVTIKEGQRLVLKIQ